jgi:hypothetical protein
VQLVPRHMETHSIYVLTHRTASSPTLVIRRSSPPRRTDTSLVLNQNRDPHPWVYEIASGRRSHSCRSSQPLDRHQARSSAVGTPDRNVCSFPYLSRKLARARSIASATGSSIGCRPARNAANFRYHGAFTSAWLTSYRLAGDNHLDRSEIGDRYVDATIRLFAPAMVPAAMPSSRLI